MKKVKCNICGNSNENGSKFCSKCGNKIEDIEINTINNHKNVDSSIKPNRNNTLIIGVFLIFASIFAYYALSDKYNSSDNKDNVITENENSDLITEEINNSSEDENKPSATKTPSSTTNPSKTPEPVKTPSATVKPTPTQTPTPTKEPVKTPAATPVPTPTPTPSQSYRITSIDGVGKQYEYLRNTCSLDQFDATISKKATYLEIAYKSKLTMINQKYSNIDSCGVQVKVYDSNNTVVKSQVIQISGLGINESGSRNGTILIMNPDDTNYKIAFSGKS